MEGFPGGSVIKKKKIHLSMQEIQVGSPSWEDPLEKEMATHSSTLAWKIPWIEQPGMLQSMGSQRVRHNWTTSLTHSLTPVSLWLVLWAWTWVSFADGFQHPLINGCLTAICDFRKKERKVKSLSHVQLFATPWTVAYYAPPSMRFSRQEYWSGCHCLLRS